MEKLLTFLNQLPTYTAMIATLAAGKSAAVTGLGQINRSHFIASVENGAKAALAIIDHGVPEAANRFNGSHP